MEAAVDILARVNYDNMEPFYSLIPVLAKLRETDILTIISSSDSQDIHIAVARFHLSGYFKDILGSDANFSKKEKIVLALNRHRMSRGQTYYICDTMGDIKEAQAVGIKTIAVTWGWHSRDQLASLHPDYLIDYPEALLEI
jgi:phosphoglycolate phosphatase